MADIQQLLQALRNWARPEEPADGESPEAINARYQAAVLTGGDREALAEQYALAAGRAARGGAQAQPAAPAPAAEEEQPGRIQALIAALRGMRLGVQPGSQAAAEDQTQR